jgi:hypothetical protein
MEILLPSVSLKTTVTRESLVGLGMNDVVIGLDLKVKVIEDFPDEQLEQPLEEEKEVLSIFVALRSVFRAMSDRSIGFFNQKNHPSKKPNAF